jgi:hypothetical protein
MNNTRIEIICSEGDVGLSCVISPGLKATLEGINVIKNRNHPENAIRVEIIPART